MGTRTTGAAVQGEGVLSGEGGASPEVWRWLARRRMWAGAAVLLALAGPALAGPAPTGTDRTALEALYDATGGDNWTTGTNWKTNNDDWYGVTTNASGQVTRLNLANNHLNGTLPTELGSLTNPTALSLNNNQLSGAIPAALGSLTTLTLLDLPGNQLSGAIPTALGNLTSLTRLDLSNNNLSGAIPTALGA